MSDKEVVHSTSLYRVVLGQSPVSGRRLYAWHARCSGCGWKYTGNTDKRTAKHEGLLHLKGTPPPPPLSVERRIPSTVIDPLNLAVLVHESDRHRTNLTKALRDLAEQFAVAAARVEAAKLDADYGSFSHPGHHALGELVAAFAAHEARTDWMRIAFGIEGYGPGKSLEEHPQVVEALKQYPSPYRKEK